MEKAIRFLVLGAVVGVCLTWLSSDLAVRAESSDGEVIHSKGAYHQRVEREVACEAAPRIVLHNQNGGVTVTSWDKSTVSVVAHKHVSPSSRVWSFFGFGGSSSEESMAAALNEIEVNVQSTAGAVSIETIFPKPGLAKNRGVNYELQVPRDATLELHTSNGRIDVSEVDGNLTLDSSNGQIITSHTRGVVSAETSNGAVTCRDAGGPLDLESSNGAITVDYTGVLAADAAIACETSNGSIDVTLPPSTAFTLDAKTSNGRIRSEFPMALPAGDDLKHISSQVGDGGGAVRLRTSNGSISLSRS